MMELIINRQSVCAGDDLEDHSVKIAVADTATYEDVFLKLKEMKYFPAIDGNNVVWVLSNKACSCIFSYFTSDGFFSPGLTEHSISSIDDGSHSFLLKYFSSPQEWKKRIIDLYNGNMYELWKDGWTKEIEHCDKL